MSTVLFSSCSAFFDVFTSVDCRSPGTSSPSLHFFSFFLRKNKGTVKPAPSTDSEIQLARSPSFLPPCHVIRFPLDQTTSFDNSTFLFG